MAGGASGQESGRGRGDAGAARDQLGEDLAPAVTDGRVERRDDRAGRINRNATTEEKANGIALAGRAGHCPRAGEADRSLLELGAALEPGAHGDEVADQRRLGEVHRQAARRRSQGAQDREELRYRWQGGSGVRG